MALVALLLACMAPEESYPTTGSIFVLEADCVSGDGVTFASQYSAVHLLGIEVCDVGCSPTEYRRAAAALTVECEAGTTVRARFLQLDMGI
jgi:hypothetical protein